jgi:hypothetical protein
LPLGYGLPTIFAEEQLLQAQGVSDRELLVLTDQGAEVIPMEMLTPLSRAGLRLALIQKGSSG